MLVLVSARWKLINSWTYYLLQHNFPNHMYAMAIGVWLTLGKWLDRRWVTVRDVCRSNWFHKWVCYNLTVEITDKVVIARTKLFSKSVTT
jgi:hypothetical protein